MREKRVMVLTFFILNIFLSLFIFILVLSLCRFNIKYLTTPFERLFERNGSTIVMAVVAYVALVFCMGQADTWWKNTYWISVDAVVMNSQEKEVTVDYGEDEFGFDDTSTHTEYIITYEFNYKGKVYQTSHQHIKDRTIGSVETIKINPNNPEDEFTPVTDIPATILVGCVMLIVLKILIRKFRKKSRHNYAAIDKTTPSFGISIDNKDALDRREEGCFGKFE